MEFNKIRYRFLPVLAQPLQHLARLSRQRSWDVFAWLLGSTTLEGSPGIYRTAAHGSALYGESGVPVFGDVFGWGKVWVV